MAETNWSSLGTPGPLPANPTLARNADGRLEVFLQTLEGTVPHLWHSGEISPGGDWSTWVSLNQPANVPGDSVPVVGMNADGRLELFMIGSDAALWHTWQTTAGGDWNTTWASLDRPGGTDLQGGLDVGSNTDGRLEVFSGSFDGAIWHIWQTTANGTWSPWASLSGLAQAPADSEFTNLPTVGRNADGRLEVFTLTFDGALWHIWQTTAGGSWRTTWFSSGQPAATGGSGSSPPPAVSQNVDGRLEVFTFGSGGAIWRIGQTTPNGTWTAWASLSAPTNRSLTTTPIVGRNADGRLEIMAIGNDGALWHIWQTAPGGSWSTWDSLSAPPTLNTGLAFSLPCVAENADGRLEVFALGGGTLWHASQLTPGGPWG